MSNTFLILLDFRLFPEIPWQHLHPVLVNFPAALIPSSVFADVVGRVANRPTLRNAGWWMLCLGAVVTPLTELAGWFWKQKLGDALPADLIQVHQWLGLSILLVLVPLVIWRGRLFVREQIPTASYFLLALVLVMCLILQGNLGGAMVFG